MTIEALSIETVAELMRLTVPEVRERIVALKPDYLTMEDAAAVIGCTPPNVWYHGKVGHIETRRRRYVRSRRYRRLVYKRTGVEQLARERQEGRQKGSKRVTDTKSKDNRRPRRKHAIRDSEDWLTRQARYERRIAKVRRERRRHRR